MPSIKVRVCALYNPHRPGSGYRAPPLSICAPKYSVTMYCNFGYEDVRSIHLNAILRYTDHARFQALNNHAACHVPGCRPVHAI